MAEFGRRDRNAGGPGLRRDEDDDDDDEDEDDRSAGRRSSKPLPVEVNEDGSVEIRGDDGQRLAFRQGAISVEQVRRLAMQSAYRSGLAS